MTHRLHSAESAAELPGVKTSTIRWWWTSGKLHRVKIGRLTRVRESESPLVIKGDSANTSARQTGVPHPDAAPLPKQKGGR